jgi:hypothetical protein
MNIDMPFGQSPTRAALAALSRELHNIILCIVYVDRGERRKFVGCNVFKAMFHIISIKENITLSAAI